MAEVYTAFWQTSSTIGATGSTSLVAAPAADHSLVLDAVVVSCRNTTAGIQEGYLNQTTASAGGLLAISDPYGVAATGAVPATMLNVSGLGWILNTATALLFISTITTASTMSMHVFVRGRTLRRS